MALWIWVSWNWNGFRITSFYVWIEKNIFKNNGHSPNKDLLNSKVFSWISVKNMTYIGTILCIPIIFILLDHGAKAIFEPFEKNLAF